MPTTVSSTPSPPTSSASYSISSTLTSSPPSPSSTVSPGDSPHLPGTAPGNSSYALHQDVPYPPRSTGSSEDAPTFFFDSNNSNSNNSYPHSAPATSDEFGDKFQYDYGMPYAAHHESSNGYPEAAGVYDAEGYPHNSGMEFASPEPFYESSHPSADTAFTYS